MPKKRGCGLGDPQAMAFVRVGDLPAAAMADSGTRVTVMSREIAERGGARPTGRRGKMNIAGHRLVGELHRVTISSSDSPTCRATVDAFVPDAGQVFRKGLILGMDFMQPAKMIVDAATGEAYCPTPKKRRRR
jgi:hypothetical protein